VIGPNTLAALQEADLGQVKQRAVAAYLRGEYAKAEADPERAKFVPGLISRAKKLLQTFG